MKRIFSLLALLLCSLPMGLSMVGCGEDSNNYCPNTDGIVHINQVFSITLQPQYTPISLAYGQTRLLAGPSAFNCLGAAQSVSGFTYGTTAPSLVDLSPTGNMCAGTWERNVGGNTPDYTICDPPAASAIPVNAADSFSYITASAQSVTSNQVQVFVHPAATSAVLYQAQPGSACSTTLQCGATGQPPTSCISQGTTSQYCAQVCAGSQDITASLGTITFTPANASIVSFDANGVAKALFPGSTVVTASVSGTSSTAGLFSTCAPTSLALQVNGSTATNLTLPPNNSAQLTVTAVDKNGTALSGLSYIFSTTSPKTQQVSTSGLVTPAYAGSGDIYAACLPPSCNPSPTGYIGQFTATASGEGPGNGQPLTSNPVRITSPGVIASTVYLASFQTPNVAVIGTANNAAAPPFKLPYTPNSMVLSRLGTELAFGSDVELMFVSTANNALTAIDKNVTGKALALSPDGTLLVFTNAAKNLIYLYTISKQSYTTIGGTGISAQWTPDGQTLYVAGTNVVNGVTVPQEFVYSTFTGWIQKNAVSNATSVAVLTPAVGAFFSGDTTTALGYCADTTGASTVLFPQSPETADAATTVLTSTNDGTRVLGADLTTGFNDIAVGIPQQPAAGQDGSTVSTPAYCSGSPYGITGADTNYTLPVPATASLTGITATPDSSAAAVTYSGPAGGVLPVYVLGTAGVTSDSVQSVPLAGGAIAPGVAVASDDDNSIYVGTSGDGALHTISVAAVKACAAGAVTCAADIAQVSTGLVDSDGNPLPADAIAVIPVKSLQ